MRQDGWSATGFPRTGDFRFNCFYIKTGAAPQSLEALFGTVPIILMFCGFWRFLTG